MAEKAMEDHDYVLWNLILLTRDAIHKAREKELVRYAITPEQAGALYAVYNLGDQATVSKICLRLMRKPHSVSNLLKRLERNGMIIKKKDGENKEAATYTLTPKGVSAYENSENRESLHKALAALSEAEKTNLESYLRKLMNLMFKDMADEMKPPWL